MKARFVVLALFIFGCATGISHAQDGGERANAATVSVRDINFLEPFSEACGFCGGAGDAGGALFPRRDGHPRCFVRKQADSETASHLARPYRIVQGTAWRGRDGGGVYCKGRSAAGDDRPDFRIYGDLLSFFRRFGFGQRHGSAVSESRRQRQQKSGADGRGRAVVVCRRRKKRDCRSSCLSALLPSSLSACAMRCRAGG